MTGRARALSICAVMLSCVRTEVAGEGQTASVSAHASDPDKRDSVPATVRELVEGPVPLLLIHDPTTLVALEREHGLGLAALLHGGEATATADYGPGPLQAIAQSLAARLAADRAEDPKHTGVGMRFVHRQFDLAWLSSPDTRFELIGVVNRMDRQVFNPNPAASRPARDAGGPTGRSDLDLRFAPESFGETRLIYRLAYTRTQQGMSVDSRLPMTINVVYWQRGAADRAQMQARWQADAGLSGAELAAWLRADGHALAPAQLDASLLKSVEIDVQTERWPSTIRPDMAGHAEYLLQVFRKDGDSERAGPGARSEAEGVGAREGAWKASPLENTPDVERLSRDTAARAALLAWLRAPEQREALDRGTLVVPDQYLATAATSVTPRGFARLANRPWSRVFTAEDFADHSFEGMTTVRSPAALLRRLDGLSCQGCHESRSIAGFHLLGAERDPDKGVDALAVFSSPHLEGELERRRAWHVAILREQAASEVRPLSEHERNRGAWGTHCGLGDPGFADWTCNDGLVCTKLSDPELGTCLEPGPAFAGGVCEVGEMKVSADHHRDRIRDPEERACAPGGVCNDNRVGFPEGMCAFSCGSGMGGFDSACGVIPNLRSFNDCLAARRPFAQCIAETANPAGMRSCSVDAPCRDDYICARSGSDAGVCLPPYFLFQLRVDGHPS